MTSPPPPQPGLAESAAALAREEGGSRALVEQALARIEATRATVNAFRRVRAAAALAEADEADRRLAAGERLPLLGVPVAVKDDTDVAGEPTAFGCAGAFPAARADSESVRRLRAAGAVIVGKTNTPEIGQWGFTEGRAFGATRNPWNLDHTPGGSSGGAAAAVAAGLVPAALGSDGAGSIRIPASWTNLVGIKPQRGRISAHPEPESFNGLTVSGPLARTVADAALLLDAAAGSHPGDRHRPPTQAVSPAAHREPGRLRIALVLDTAFAIYPLDLDPEIRRATLAMADTLAALGHDVSGTTLRYGPIGFTQLPRALAGIRAWSRRVPDPALLDPRTRANIRNGALLGPLLGVARAAEPWLQRRVGAVFRTYDAVLTPTTATPPPLVGATDAMDSAQLDRAMLTGCPYAWPWNVLGWPGVGIPAGFTAAGLPVGCQLLGPAFSEPLLVSLAAQLEDVRQWHRHRPPTSAPKRPVTSEDQLRADVE